MGLVTTPLDIDFRASLDFVLTTASNTSSDLLPGRYANEDWASKARRSLFESFHCPVDLASPKGITNAETGHLLSRLRFLQFDFEAQSSESEKQAIERCRQMLRNGSYEEAQAMWASIQQITANYRTTAGGVDRNTVLRRLPSQFRLRELPDCRDDWNRLRSLAVSNMALVKDTIGKEIQLQHAHVLSVLRDTLLSHGGAVLVGASGVGKSSAAKAFAKACDSDGEAVLWFNPSSLDKPDFAAFQSDLQLTHTVEELLHSVSSQAPLLVFDGLDRLYASTAMQLVGALAQLVATVDGLSPWKTVITCQTQDWPRLRNRLIDVGLPVDDWPCIDVKTWSADDLGPVWKAIPGTARLRSQKKLQPLWGNLKILDLLATRIASGSHVETATWVGETDVATWYWDSYVRSGDTQHVRERFAIMLAEKEASELRSVFPLDTFSVSELAPYESLRIDGTCQSTPDGRIKFAHDLFGDWARLRILIAHTDDFPSFIETRIDSPLWHRAIRLYGIYLLENGNDIDRWRSIRRTLVTGNNTSASDLLLEAAVFSANPVEVLFKLKEDLFQSDGADLRRLLGRFLTSSTVPDTRFETDVRLLNPQLASHFRAPIWVDWPPMLKFLFENREDAVACAPVEVAKIAALWFEHTPEDFPFRNEMASIGLLLGAAAYSGWRDHDIYVEERKLLYRVALAGAAHYPDEVASLALEVAKRGGNRDEEDDEQEGMLPFGITHDPRYDPNAAPEEPWPDGPYGRVDDDFRHAILDEGAVVPLIRTRPGVAREVILAVMLKKRRRFDWYNSVHYGRELDLDHGDDWSTPLYTQGPFLPFLQLDFSEGLETIARLVDFASERWMYYTQLAADEYRQQPQAADLGVISEFIEDAARSPGKTVLTLVHEDRVLLGDDRVYGWSGNNPPSALGPALMALEKYFYDELDAGRSITEKVGVVLQRTRSVALLKVLCDVGKREQSLFRTVLQPLLSMAELYLWEQKDRFKGRQHLLMFAFRKPRWFVDAARVFHNLSHRKIDIEELAIRLFLFDETSRDFLSQVRMKWQSLTQEMLDQKSRANLQRMIDAFDIESYLLSRDEDGQLQVINRRAHERYLAQQSEREAQQRKLRMMMLPAQARGYIDEGKFLTHEELADLWSLLESFCQESTTLSSNSGVSVEVEPTEGNAAAFSKVGGLFRVVAGLVNVVCRGVMEIFARGRNDAPRESDKPIVRVPPKSTAQIEQENDEADVLMAVVALLFRQSKEWLDLYPERKQWCLDRLVAVIYSPAPRRQFDVPDSVAAWSWDCFAGELIAKLWLEDPNNPRFRYMLARLIVLAPHYIAINIIFSRCSEQRKSVRKDFAQLRSLIFHVANMRERIRFVQQYGAYGEFSPEQVNAFQRSVDPWANGIVQGFIDGSLQEIADKWDDLDSNADYVAIDAVRRRHLPHHMLDMELIRAAHSWLPSLDEAIDDQERLEWVGYWRSAQSFILHRIHADRDDKRYPYEYERWVLDRIGSILAQMRQTESPQSLWEPVLSLPRDCHYWGELMLRSFHQEGLSRDPTSLQFEATRTAIVEHMLDAGIRSPIETWSDEEDAWQALIGIDHITRASWLARHHVIASRGLSLLRRWTTEIAASSLSQLAALAVWLRQDVADSIRIELIMEVYAAMKRTNLFAISPRDDSGNAIASLLHTVWEKDAISLRTNEVALVSFKGLLRWLVDRQNPVALELARQVGSL
jgi:hypothetical protein